MITIFVGIVRSMIILFAMKMNFGFINDIFKIIQGNGGKNAIHVNEPMLLSVQHALRASANVNQSTNLSRFFKTGKGEYGEGDQFLGLKVPEVRAIVKNFDTLSLPDLEQLLNSAIHEERLTALIILVEQFKRGTPKQQKQIFDFYLAHTNRINNWDLVDTSAPQIVGGYLLDKPRTVLNQLVRSRSLWERRIAVLATFMFIRQGQFAECLRFSEILLNDTHDLMHKAVGWMLREVGKRDIDVLRTFLNVNVTKMPRTMLRYAIEKFPEVERRAYLTKK